MLGSTISTLTLFFFFEKKTLTVTLHYDYVFFSCDTKCSCNIISYCFTNLVQTTFKNYITCSKMTSCMEEIYNYY